jgi:hypothetical protein
VILPVCVCGVVFLWFNQPWLPYTEHEIQNALETHYSQQRAIFNLKGIWDDASNCKVAIVNFSGEGHSDGTYYVTLYRIDGKWQYVGEESSGGLWPGANCNSFKSKTN